MKSCLIILAVGFLGLFAGCTSPQQDAHPTATDTLSEFRALFEMEQYEAVIAEFEELPPHLQMSDSISEYAFLAVSAYGKLALKEPDAAKRNILFNEAAGLLNR
jgi:hypothetical protein